MRAWVRLLAVFVLAGVLSGCGYGLSIDNRSLVSAVGFDVGTHDTQTVSTEIVNPMASAAAPITQGPPDVVFYATQRSISDALLTIQREAPGDLDLSASQVIVLSLAYLHHGITSAVSFLARPSNGRLGAWVVASVGSARGLLSVPVSSTASTPFFQIYDMENFIAARSPVIAKTPFWMLYRSLYTPWFGTVIPIVSARGQTISFQGAALLDRGRLSGRLTNMQTAVYDMLGTGRAGLRLSTLVQGRMVNVNIYHVKTSLGVGANLHGNIHLAVRALVEEDPLGLGAASHVRAWRQTIQSAVAHHLDQEVDRTLTALQRAHDDALGFAVRLRAEDPRLWAKSEADWPAIFSRMPVAISVSVKVSTPGP